MHILPKIHRLNESELVKINKYGFNIDNIMPPCRPIISQIGTVTEFIGRYIDYFLVPMVQKQHTYIKDTSDLIYKLERIKPNADCWLCSFDVVSMYTNCPIDELLSAVRISYDQFDKSDYKIKCPPTDDLIYLLRSILENNIFDFNGQLYKQRIGAAIGAVPSPEICDILMYKIMKEILSKFEHRKNIFFYGRYRDDIILIYHGDSKEIKDLLKLANIHHPFLKFTLEFSSKEIIFLDVNIFKGTRFSNENILDVKTHFKPTNAFLYLDRKSCHSRHVFAGFIKGEVIRYIRTTNNDVDLQYILLQFRSNLIKRGYKEIEIEKYITEALSCNRSDLIRKKAKQNTKEIPLVLATKFNPCIHKLKQCISKHWDLLKQDAVCNEIFSSKPIIAYKKHKNIADLLTTTKLK